MDYLTRLEQGRASNPSASVLGSLARALRLSDIERDHLYQLAGQSPPGDGVIDTHIPASVLRLMDRLSDVAVMVTTVAGEIVAANPLAMALSGEATGPTRRERTVAWRRFMGFPSSRVTKTEEERIDAEEVLVADLQSALARYPADTFLTALVADLRHQSPRFEALWSTHRLRRGHAREKHFVHPEVGELTLDCDDLTIEGSDLRSGDLQRGPGVALGAVARAARRDRPTALRGSRRLRPALATRRTVRLSPWPTVTRMPTAPTRGRTRRSG